MWTSSCFLEARNLATMYFCAFKVLVDNRKKCKALGHTYSMQKLINVVIKKNTFSEDKRKGRIGFLFTSAALKAIRDDMKILLSIENIAFTMPPSGTLVTLIHNQQQMVLVK